MVEMADIPFTDKCIHVLAKNRIAVLSTLRHTDGLLSSNPVAYLWDGSLRISTLKSRFKYKNLCADSRLSVCVISPDNVMEYTEIRGYASLDDDPDRSFFREQYVFGAGEEPPDDIDPPEAERAIITVHPVQISSPRIYGGRFDQAPE